MRLSDLKADPIDQRGFERLRRRKALTSSLKQAVLRSSLAADRGQRYINSDFDKLHHRHLFRVSFTRLGVFSEDRHW